MNRRVFVYLLGLLLVLFAGCNNKLTGPFSDGNGTESNPYLISKAGDLDNIRNHMYAHYLQVADINLGVSPWNFEEGWNPIGYFIDESNKKEFKGSYDGNGYKITNAKIDRPEEENIGLFGFISEATLRNITLESFNITGGGYTGGLVAISNNSLLINCSVSGEITGNYNTGGLASLVNDGEVVECSFAGSVTGTTRTGGLIGTINEATVSDCEATGNVLANGDYAGGLVAYNRQNSAILNSRTSVTISGQGDYYGGLVGVNDLLVTVMNCSANGEVNGNSNVGGLAGLNNESTIVNSHATGNVSGISTVGGLVGMNWNGGMVNNCFATGIIEGNCYIAGLVAFNHNSSVEDSYAVGAVIGATNDIGGLIGLNIQDSVVNRCYSIGNVSGSDYRTGGLIGWNTASTVNDSYWNTETSGQNDSAGGEGLTTTDMLKAASYTNWDFEYIWRIIEDTTYPYFVWQGEAGEFNYPR